MLEAIRDQNACFRNHADHMDYAAFPVDGISRVTQVRGTGMRPYR
ncbi:MAG TPA: hypothetical protein P5026_04010 [Kiritimatiellia bacterium]|nr:hypothetical protein [Kiritimatiellia bacterium]HRU70157.1 hypothetical protein [Kiritimatiellia bacterium]